MKFNMKSTLGVLALVSAFPVGAQARGGDGSGGGAQIESAFRIRARELISKVAQNSEASLLCSPKTLEKALRGATIQVVDTLTDPETHQPIHQEDLDAWTVGNVVQLKSASWHRFFNSGDAVEGGSVDVLILHELYRATQGACIDDSFRKTEQLSGIFKDSGLFKGWVLDPFNNFDHFSELCGKTDVQSSNFKAAQKAIFKSLIKKRPGARIQIVNAIEATCQSMGQPLFYFSMLETDTNSKCNHTYESRKIGRDFVVEISAQTQCQGVLPDDYDPDYSIKLPAGTVMKGQVPDSLCTRVGSGNTCQMTFDDAEKYCSTRGGLPTVKQIAWVMNPQAVSLRPWKGYDPVYLANGKIGFYYVYKNYEGYSDSASWTKRESKSSLLAFSGYYGCIHTDAEMQYNVRCVNP